MAWLVMLKSLWCVWHCTRDVTGKGNDIGYWIFYLNPPPPIKLLISNPLPNQITNVLQCEKYNPLRSCTCLASGVIHESNNSSIRLFPARFIIVATCIIQHPT